MPLPLPTRRPHALHRAAVAAALLLCGCSSQPIHAHDWTSPEAAYRQHAPRALSALRPWSGTLWAGPSSGEPAAPSASDCRRAPRIAELSASGPVPAHGPRGSRLAAPGEGDESAAAVSDRAGSDDGDENAHEPDRETARDDRDDGARKAGTAKSQPMAAPSTSDLERDAPSPAAEARAAAPQGRLFGRSVQRPRARQHEPVSAGMIDDNADFGSFLAYRERHAELAVRPLGIDERYRLTVHDAEGRPVPDARVRVFAGRRALTLWARTDSGGEVWLHPAAAGAAADPVLEVEVRKGSAQARALLRRGQRDQLQVRLDAVVPAEPTRLDLVFLVDATGSMADEIHKLRRSMRLMAEQIAALPSRPDICFGLVAYRDRGDAFFVRAHDFTDDLPAFQRQLAALEAGGGGDMPEALNEALHTAVHRLSWRGEGATRMVVLVADAPPHLDYGAPYYDDDLQGALARGVKLFTVGASGLDASGEYVFRQAAQFTGGRFVFLTYARADDPASGPGRETVHDVEGYSVESLDKLVVRLVREELARRPDA